MDAYVGQIILFAGNYEPENWAICDGRSLLIQNYVALYSLIGVIYGGDARTTFNLPDLRGRVPVGQGQGTALTMRTLGQSFGTEAVALTEAQLPAHQHQLLALSTPATSPSPIGNLLAQTQGQDVMYFTPPATGTPAVMTLDPATVGSSGQGYPHENRMPMQALNYLICLNGLYPDRP